MMDQGLDASTEFAPRRSLGAQAVVLAAATGLSQIIIAALYVYAARESTVVEYGQAIAAIALGMAAGGLLDFGSNAFWVREMSAGRLTSEAFSNRASWKIALVLVTAAAWAAGGQLLAPGSLYWCSGFIAFGQALSQTVQARLRARGRAEYAGIVILLDRLTAAVLFLSLSVANVGVLEALVVALVLGPTLSGLVANVALLGDGRLRLVLRRPINPWRGSGAFGVASTAFALQSYGDVPLVAWSAGPAAAGVYGAVNRWTQPMALLAQAFTAASAPYVASATSVRAAVRRQLSAAWLPAFAVGTCGAMIVFAPWIVVTLLGNPYVKAATVLRLLAAGTIVHIVAQPFYTLLMVRGHDRAGATLVGSSVCVTLGLVVVLAPGYGAAGAGVAYVAGQMMLLVGVVVAAVLMFGERKTPQRPSSGPLATDRLPGTQRGSRP